MLLKLKKTFKYTSFLTACLFLLLSAIGTPNAYGQHLSSDPSKLSAKPEGPVITIRGKGVKVSNGDTITKRVNNTDFGQVEVFGAIPKHRFTITNTGDEILQMRNPGTIQLKGTDTMTFSIEEQPDSRLGPNDTTSFQIQFDPDTQKLQTATVEIPSNDSSRSPFTFRISGQGAPYTNTEDLKDLHQFHIEYSQNKVTAVFQNSINTKRHLKLTDIKGHSFWETNLRENQLQVRIPTNHLRSGIYILHSKTPDSHKARKILVD